MYRMALRDGTTYTLDDAGYVLARSDGPKGWNYGKGWRIIGFGTRWNSGYIVPLTDAAAGAWTGHGFVHDWDHGTRRVWGSPRGHRLATIRRVEIGA